MNRLVRKRCLDVGVLAIALLVVAGCAEKIDPNVAAARKYGADEARRRDFKLVTDCGAFEDEEQRYGCAEYVNSHKQ
jgi:hypothetical protein